VAVETKRLGNGVTIGVDVATQVLRFDGRHLVSRAQHFNLITTFSFASTLPFNLRPQM